MSEEFKETIRNERKSNFPKSFDIVHDTFLELDLHKKKPDYFFNNASIVVDNLRENNWRTFLTHERRFSESIYKSLIRDDLKNLEVREAIENYIDENVNNFYTLSLSNTQSRRSRAGNEFEAIIGHVFMGAHIPFDEQGLIGTGIFSDKNLAKLVDHVVPGAIEYGMDKRKTLAISAKTTLRERWQQIGDEMQRTRMPEMYLATLDEGIGENTLQQLMNNNIYPVTTASIKKECYPNNNIVITFEELLKTAKVKASSWSRNDFDEGNLEEKIKSIEKSIAEHADKPYVVDYLKRIKETFKKI